MQKEYEELALYIPLSSDKTLRFVAKTALCPDLYIPLSSDKTIQCVVFIIKSTELYIPLSSDKTKDIEKKGYGERALYPTKFR